MPVTYTIEIKRDPVTLELVYERTNNVVGGADEFTSTQPFRVSPGDKVCWTSKLGSFSIIFNDASPFFGGTSGGVTVFGAAKGKTTSKWLAKKLVSVPPPSGSNVVVEPFKYTVTLVEGIGVAAKAEVVDPLMEIEDGGGGI